MYTMEITIAEKRVLSKYSLKTVALGGHQDDMLKNAYALVTVDDINVLSNQYLSD